MTLLRTHMPTGPLVVGCCDIMVGRSRKGSLMRLFYPAEAKQLPADESKWTRWFLGEEYSMGVAQLGIPKALQGIAAMALTWQTQHSIVPSIWCGDILSPSTAPTLPVVVFSHGLSGNRSMYSSVCCHLASHGYVVAALEHRDGSASSSFTFSDTGAKERVPFEPVLPGEREFVLRSAQLATRIEEASQTLTVLERLNAGGEHNELPSSFSLGKLVGRLDLTKPIMAGHSFGACTAIATTYKDERFKLCVALDPWMYPLKDAASVVCAGVRRHTLCVSTEAFQTPENLLRVGCLPSELSSFVTIKGTVHQNQVDTPFLLGLAGRLFAGTQSRLHYATAMNINNELVTAFIHAHHGVPYYSRPPGALLLCYGHLVECGLVLGLTSQAAPDQHLYLNT